MPHFSKRSQAALASAHPILQVIFNDVIQFYDCVIICGHRGKADQTAAYESGASEKEWPSGAHNSAPSNAVDVAPWVNDDVSYDQVQCGVLAGIVMATARKHGVHDLIRWGGDWDGDQDTNDQKLHDLVHFEVKQ